MTVVLNLNTSDSHLDIVV